MKMDPKLHFETPLAISEAIVVELLKMPKETINATGLRSARFIVPIGERTPAHRHVQTEMWFICAGSGVIQYENEKVDINGGDVVYFEPDRTHSILNSGNVDLRIFSIAWLD